MTIVWNRLWLFCGRPMCKICFSVKIEGGGGGVVTVHNNDSSTRKHFSWKCITCLPTIHASDVSTGRGWGVLKWTSLKRSPVLDQQMSLARGKRWTLYSEVLCLERRGGPCMVRSNASLVTVCGNNEMIHVSNHIFKCRLPPNAVTIR